MTVRHITRADNVDSEGFLIDPTIVHHGAVQGSHLASLAGAVDPTTHLNLDYPDHELGECVIAVTFDIGAEIVLDENGQFERAQPRFDASTSLGFVDQGARRIEWLNVLRERRG
jgi:hypothetical protein